MLLEMSYKLNSTRFPKMTKLKYNVTVPENPFEKENQNWGIVNIRFLKKK